MTAGRGIVHSEMPEQEEGLMWGFQLWVNLPAKDKMTAPRYQDIPPGDDPRGRRGPRHARVRVIVGRVGDVNGPVSAVATDPLYLDVTLPAGTSLRGARCPRTHNAFVYVFEGDGEDRRGEQRRARRARGARHGERVGLAAGPEGARLLVVAGRPLNEPVARYGPFVMNTDEEIRQAFADYQSGRF